MIAAFFAVIILISSTFISAYAEGYGDPVAASSYLPFDDLKSDWSREYIGYVYSKGLMRGTGDRSFGPTLPLTRGMVVTVLYRLYLSEGNPEYSYRPKYADVPYGQYYSEAVTWASDMEIVTYTHTNMSNDPCYSPNRNITRQELAVMFFRYAEFKNINILMIKDLSSFKDGASVASWASEGIRWAVRCGLINGTGNGSTLSPVGEATREQFAAIVARFLQTEFVCIPDHIFYENKDTGISGTLTGDVAIISIFVSDNVSRWTEEDRDTALTCQQEQLDAIVAEADRYGAELETYLGYYEGYYDGEFNNDTHYNAAKEVIRNLGFESFADLQSTVENYFNAEESAIIFCVNKNLRSFAIPAAYGDGEEYAVVYYNASNAYAHEMCHLFGARDYYIHNEISASAKKNFGECIMTDSSLYVVDSLSAYLMGWTDDPRDDAMNFLKETSHITQEEFDAAKEYNTYTGDVTDYVGDGFVYTGYLNNGVFDRYGKVIYDNGNTYEGGFNNGLQQGMGTYTWASSGNSYYGEWDCGNIHGLGTFTWSNGDSYRGMWEYDERHGEGIYRTASGKRYKEVWEYGTRISSYPL